VIQTPESGMSELKTSESLLRRLRAGATTTLTADEIYKQRVSFIVGTLKKSSGVTDDRIRDVLSKQEGLTKS
jgi:hypothetical protein